jgi:hypothetical protein
MWTTFGGYVKEIPKPHKRFFDDKRRVWPIRVSITRYMGIGVHYYPSLELESNPIWNAEAKSWQLAHDDDEGAEKRIRGPQCNSYEEAAKWVEYTYKTRFGRRKQRYKLVHQFTDERWFYREGD